MGPVITHPGSEADAPEARALGKRAVSPVGSTAEVGQASAGAMQPSPWRPAATGGHRVRASGATTAITKEGSGAETVASPFEVSVFSAELVASPIHSLVVC